MIPVNIFSSMLIAVAFSITEIDVNIPLIFFFLLSLECGGKMHLREGEFEKAHTDFFEAFKNYDESGSPRRTTCLKYLVLANMLMKSGINPFDSQEVWIPLLTFILICVPPT